MRFITIILIALLPQLLFSQAKIRAKAGVAVVVPPVVPSDDGSFSFILATSSVTSAGVYLNDSIKVKNLWNNVTYASGTHTEYWDGTDDFGDTIVNPAATYTVIVLSNNVEYEWEGGCIGNTSDSLTGNTKYQGYYNCMLGLAFASNGYGYYCNGFSEGEASYAKFDVTTPQTRVNFYGSSPTRVLSLNTQYVCTDNTNVYWGGYDSYSANNSMVHAITCASDANVTFSSGVNYTVTNGIVINAISRVNQANVRITGLAVQKTGIYLFVARAAINQLQVLNKTTGALVQTLTYSNVHGLSVDASDNLWMCTGTNTVAKYTVQVGGTLSAATLTLSGLIKPMSTSVNPAGTVVAVCDDSTNQYVRFFDNSTGSLNSTLGTAGGYAANATVSNTKFYFHDDNTTVNTSFVCFVAWQLDGTSYWVNDPGNFRVQKYNTSNVYQTRIMSLGTSYSTWVDPNNSVRVFAGPLEFEMDYSQPLSGSTGWSLVRNWGATLTATYLKPYLTYPTTLSNGRTYAILVKPGGSNNREFVELPTTGVIRLTGTFRNGAQIMDSTGSIQTIVKGAIGGTSIIRRYALTGFNGSNNPLWDSTPEVLATTPTLTINDPNDVLTGNTITSSNKVIMWNPDREVNATTPYVGFHTGAIYRGGNSWLWKHELATHTNYQGQYPAAGYFDIGNYVHNNAGGTLSIYGRNLFTSYHGEFWKNTQTNKFNHYYDNGLSIGQFGIVKEETSGNSPAEFAGNVLTPMVVGAGGDSMWLYHGDESTHSGLHRWKVTGLSTVATQSSVINFPTGYVAPTLNYTDLMAGLPFDVVLPNNTNGWTRNPTIDTTGWTIRTSYYVYDKLAPRDIRLNFAAVPSRSYYLYRDLGTVNVSNDWSVAGDIAWEGKIGNRASIGLFLDILDISGKIMATIYYNVNNEVVLNTVPFATNPDWTGAKYFQPFSITMITGNLTMIYNGQSATPSMIDPTADWTKPKTLRVKCTVSGSPNTNKSMNLGNLKLYTDIL